MFQFTAQYSNAVLVAILPYVSDFARKLELPIPLPVTTNHVRSWVLDPDQLGGGMTLTNGSHFSFENGYVDAYWTAGRFAGREGRIDQFFGQVKLSPAEAVAVVRAAIHKLGYNEESLYVDLEPAIEMPEQFGSHVAPYYRVEWCAPNLGPPRSVEVGAEVNGSNGEITSLQMTSYSLWRPPPTLPPEVLPPRPTITPRPEDKEVRFEGAEKDALRLRIVPQVEDYIRRVELPLPTPLATNHIQEFGAISNKAGLQATLVLTNGARFYWFQDGHIAYWARDVFFDFLAHVRVKDYAGPWRMTEGQAIDMVRRAVRRLGLSPAALGMNKWPYIERPNLRGKITIPRLQLNWETIRGGMSVMSVQAEVDANHKEIKRLGIVPPYGDWERARLRER